MSDSDGPRMPIIDVSVAADARMYDWALGGTDSYAADLAALGPLHDLVPDLPQLAQENRRFLERVVHFLAGRCGVRQFLDLGCGLPTPAAREGRRFRHVHEIARDVHPGSRTVYVDRDPQVWGHARFVLDDGDGVGVVLADLTDLDAVFTDPQTTRLLDLERPVAVLLLAVLHCVPDSADPTTLIHAVTRRLVPGSFVAVSHLVADDATLRRRYTHHMTTATGGAWGRVRERREVDGFLAPMDLVEPGMVEVSRWRPAGSPAYRRTSHEVDMYGGVARIW
ncbi:SAM-dependent methyltransferase [Embleya sp. AB8]|uniref:SAM-dependent methyltransferase n=1 Tax=Embleya sp. AB8 TaxID=3156304 RepID=UPI003C70BAB8